LKINIPVDHHIHRKLKEAGLEHDTRVSHVEIDADSYAHFLKRIATDYTHISSEEQHALAVSTCLTHPDHRDKQKPVRIPIQKVKTWPWYHWLIIVIALAIALCFTALARCQGTSQIDVITFKNAANTTVKSYAAPFTIKEGTGVTFSAAGSVMTVNAAGGAGGYTTIQSATVAITQRAVANFFGAIFCVDNAGATRSDCTLAANAAVGNQYLTGIDASGNFLRKQIAYGELSGVPATFAPTAHAILSASHSDTTVGTVARGDVITGQGVSAKWTRLPKGAATNVLKMDTSAVDVLWGAVDFSELTNIPQFAQAGNCTGTDKFSAFNASNGLFTCTADVGAATPTGTGFVHVTAGAQDAASKTVDFSDSTEISANQGTTTTLLHGNAAGQPAFGAVVSADHNITATTCTNQFVSAISSTVAGTCTTDTLASAQHANQGTTTTVLHGNAAGNPAFGSIAQADVTNGYVDLSTGQTVAGLKAFTGANTNCWIQAMPVAGSSCFATIAAAYAALPSSAWPNGGGTVIVPAYYVETLAANLVLNKSSTTIRFLGSASINLGAFIISVPSGTHNLSLVSDLSHGQTPAVNTGVVIQSYTGAAAMMSVGDASGTVQNFYLRGIGFNFPSGPALANATALLLTNVQYYTIDNPSCDMGAVSGQVCYSLVGTGAFFNGIGNFFAPECIASTSATNNTCIFGGAITNGINIFGGHIDMGGVLNGSTGIDVNGTASGGWYVAGFDCDVSNTCVKVESTAIAAISGFVRQDSGSTSTANFATGSQGNNLLTNAVLPVTDTGVAGTNSVVTPNALAHNTRAWTMTQSTGSMIWNDKVDASSRLLFAQGAGQSSRLNGGSGAGTVNLAWDQGTGGVLFGNGAGASVASVNSAGLGKFANTKQVITSNFTTSATTLATAGTITGLSFTTPASVATNWSFNCNLVYSQATAGAANIWGTITSGTAPTSMLAAGEIYTSLAGAETDGTKIITTAASTTVVTATPSAAGAIGTTADMFTAHIWGTIEAPSNASPSIVGIAAASGSASDALTIYRGSSCSWY
jgi:hypothetical protein